VRANAFWLLLLAPVLLNGDEKYSGPVPSKPDLPYLLNASSLKETEVADTYVVPGASSPVKTPLAEPIFILDARKIAPEHLELYLMDVKNGNREVSPSTNGHKGASHVLYLRVTPLRDHLFKIEASEPLENGEYALTPNGDKRVFCFEVY
jgi:hypothetical protein